MKTRHTLAPFALAGALALAAGCGGEDGPGKLGAITLAGLPVSPPIAVSRHAGHYMAVLLNGTTWHLPPKGTLWEQHPVSLARIFPETLADGRNYGIAANGVVYRQDGASWVPTIEGVTSSLGALPIAIGATPAGDLLAATEVGIGSYRLFRMSPGDPSWTKLGEGTSPALGRLWITSEGRFIGWRRGVGLVALDPATAAQTTIVACGHPSLTEGGCNDYGRPAIADRAGNLIWPNSLDGNGYEVALWKLAHGQTEPTQVAGPKLEKLQKSSGGFNLYRPGGPDGMSLYVDGSNRVWMAFGWGENGGSDVGYLYRAGGGGWEFQRDDLARIPRLFGDGKPPGVMGIDAYGATLLQLP